MTPYITPVSCSHTVGVDQRDPFSTDSTDGQRVAQSSVRGGMSVDNPMTQGVEMGFKNLSLNNDAAVALCCE